MPDTNDLCILIACLKIKIPVIPGAKRPGRPRGCEPISLQNLLYRTSGFAARPGM